MKSKMESIGLFEIDMSEIKRNQRKKVEILREIVDLIDRKMKRRLPNGRYKK